MKRPITPLKGWQAFGETFEKGKKFRSRFILMSVIFSRASDEIEDVDEKQTNKVTQFGVGISKRVAKSAVVRNRVRRLLRESLYSLGREGKLSGIDKIIVFCLVAPKYPMGLKMNDVKEEISYLLGKNLAG
jgi:ribonuclease P protein component